MTPLVLTAFQTWLPHQVSNASDDLLAIIEADRVPGCTFLRQLPVETASASQKVIATLAQLRPAGVICCGMAESRSRLSVESGARGAGTWLKTSLDLPRLVAPLSATDISDDAGQFVCEGLYFQVLQHLQTLDWPCWALFVHVPRLTAANQAVIVQDFRQLRDRLLATDGR